MRWLLFIRDFSPSLFISVRDIFFERTKAKALLLRFKYESTCRRNNGFGRIIVGTRYFRNWFHEPNGNDDFRLPTKAQEDVWSPTIEQTRGKGEEKAEGEGGGKRER